MAKRSGMLLVIAALLVVGLIGFLFFSPCGVTIEKFQDAPAETEFVPPVLEETAFVTPVLEETASVPPVLEEPPPMPVQAIKQPRPAPSQQVAPQPAPQVVLQPAPQVAPQVAPQASIPVTKSMTSSQPIAFPTKVPIAPTPASSPAALTLTPAQCSSLCPITQESCESKFSCQTRLEPIGVTPMTSTSTPAPVK